MALLRSGLLSEVVVMAFDTLRSSKMRSALTVLGVSRWSPARAARAHLYLAMAMANRNEPQQAADHGLQAIASSRDFGTLRRAKALDTTLTAGYAAEPDVQEFHERYRQLARQAVTN